MISVDPNQRYSFYLYWQGLLSQKCCEFHNSLKNNNIEQTGQNGVRQSVTHYHDVSRKVTLSASSLLTRDSKLLSLLPFLLPHPRHDRGGSAGEGLPPHHERPEGARSGARGMAPLLGRRRSDSGFELRRLVDRGEHDQVSSGWRVMNRDETEGLG